MRLTARWINKESKLKKTKMKKMKSVIASLLNNVGWYLLLGLLFAFAPAAKAQMNENVTAEVNALFGTMPESSSWSNTTLKIDVGYVGLGIGQTGTAEAYLRGTYNLGATFGLAVEGDFGADNAIDGGLILAEVHKDLSDWAELYGVGGGGYSFNLHTPEYLVGFGTRVIPLGSIPQLAVDTEVDMLGTPAIEGASAPHARLLAGLTYHF